MAQFDDKLVLSKKAKREMSQFIGHELLYDYLIGNLDRERRVAVEDHVKFSRDAQMDLAKIQAGQIYAEKLSHTIVSQPVLNQINTPTNYLSVLLQKTQFEKWPQGLKWGLEALVVVLAIVTALTITPWEKIMQFGLSTGSKEVVLAEVSKIENQDIVGDTTPKASVVEENPEFVDEGVKEKEATKPVVVAKPPVTPSPVPAENATVTEAKTHAETGITQNQTGGFLYRGQISVTNIDAVREKITDKIAELGGRKAGSVELGWKKTPTSSYYHFTIPEAKYQDLMTFMSTYGKLTTSKEKHSRVMPDGIIRLIITLDEAKK